MGSNEGAVPLATEISPRPLDQRVPRIPPGQRVTDKWPVLHYQEPAPYNLAKWDFRVWGEVEAPVRWTWPEFTGLPSTTITSDIHCVTHWSKVGNVWEGVHVREVLAHVRLKPSALFVMVHADPGYTANVTLAELDQDDVLFALRHNGAPLAHEHGGPLRLVLPSLYFWKSAKWVRGLEFMDHESPGFWEQAGYHVRGDPWLEERYGGEVRVTMQAARSRALRDGRRVSS
ncbi:MAG: sulfite oxidase-like oxidoreductase [Actinobacteria bacterium]|nr:sulfite oxidase-like oxidoreductase [Actinomycetota bacterium]